MVELVLKAIAQLESSQRSVMHAKLLAAAFASQSCEPLSNWILS